MSTMWNATNLPYGCTLPSLSATRTALPSSGSTSTEPLSYFWHRATVLFLAPSHCRIFGTEPLLCFWLSPANGGFMTAVTELKGQVVC